MRRGPQENAQAFCRIADAQGGSFSAAQARQAGYAYSQQHLHVERGNWLRVDRGVFRLRDYAPAEREDLIRWSLWSRNQKRVPQNEPFICPIVYNVVEGMKVELDWQASGELEWFDW